MDQIACVLVGYTKRLKSLHGGVTVTLPRQQGNISASLSTRLVTTTLILKTPGLCDQVRGACICLGTPLFVLRAPASVKSLKH